MSDRARSAHASSRPGGTGGVKRWLTVACAVLLVLFFVLNLQDVKVHLLLTTVRMPLIIALAIAALLGLLLGWAVPRLRRSPS